MNAATVQTLGETAGLTRADAMTFAVAPRAGYGTRTGPNWIAIAAIVLVHLLGLWALMALDVIHVARTQPKPLVMTLIPDTPPPPAAPPPAEVRPDIPPPTTVVVPVPEVKAPTPPVAIAVTTVAPPPAPSAAPAAPAAAPAPEAAPITPPSANAATLNNPAPRYPIEARRKHEEGTVRLRVVITVEGRVKEIGIAASSGHDSLDEAALAAVRRWRFVPGMQAGRPVEAVGFVPIPFRLT